MTEYEARITISSDNGDLDDNSLMVLTCINRTDESPGFDGPVDSFAMPSNRHDFLYDATEQMLSNGWIVEGVFTANDGPNRAYTVTVTESADRSISFADAYVCRFE